MRNKIRRLLEKKPGRELFDKYIFGFRFYLLQSLYSQKPGTFKKEIIPFPKADQIPEMDLAFTNTHPNQGFSYNGFVIDVIDFNKRIVTRWSVAAPLVTKFTRSYKRTVSKEKRDTFKKPAFSTTLGNFKARNKCPHTSHISLDGYICTPNYYYINFIDTDEEKVYFLPDDYNENLMVYARTGCFSTDKKYFYFVRWPLVDSLEIKYSPREFTTCEIGRIRLEDHHVEIVYKLEYNDHVHQISLSEDKRYSVFTTFRTKCRIPYPTVPIEEDIEGYRRCHEAGLELTRMATVDMKAGQHWFTDIPVGADAHVEFDPVEPYIFYLAAHNFAIGHQKIGKEMVARAVMEGPGTLFKMKIEPGKTSIIGSYSDDRFIRITQHVPFRFNGKTLLADATNTNEFVILYAETMSLWRRVEIFPQAFPDFSKTGSAVLPMTATPLTLNSSRDGRFLVIGLQRHFVIFDVLENRILDLELLLPGGIGMGHTRTRGY